MNVARCSVALSPLLAALLAVGCLGPDDGSDGAAKESTEAVSNEIVTAEALATGTQLVVQAPERQFLTSGFLGRVQANGNAEQAATFTAIDRGARKIALRAPSGKYLTAAGGGGGRVTATATGIGLNETFVLVNLGDGKTALRCADGEHYVRAEGAGGGEVNAETDQPGPWTRFSLVTRRRGAPSRAFGIGGVNEWQGPAALGAKWMRTGFGWSGHQPQENGPLVGQKDEVARQATAHGVKILGVLAYAPPWAQLASCRNDTTLTNEFRSKCEPRSAEEFGRWAGMMARHYAPLGVHHWEIWNEPNSKWFWRPLPNTRLYAKMLAAAYDAMKIEDPEATIVAGATASLGVYNPEETPDADQIDPRNFLMQIYEHGGGDKFDALSHHPYTWSNPNSPIESNDNWSMMYRDEPAAGGRPAIPSLVTILRNHGDGGKKIWNTEYGVPTSKLRASGHVITQQQQSDIMLQSFGLWEDYPWAGPFLWFNYQDFDTRAPDTVGNQHLGITTSLAGEPGCTPAGRPTGTAKLAYCTFLDFMK